jgi:hypothetical protein
MVRSLGRSLNDNHGTMNQMAKSSRALSWGEAILISLGMMFVLYILLAYERRLAPLIVLIIFATSIWATVDSARIDLRGYKTRIALHPLVLFNAMYLLWFVLLPWYLVIRSKIRAGTLLRREGS